MDKKLYRLYADESGHSHLDSGYLGITGCIIESNYYKNEFVPALAKVKEDYFDFPRKKWTQRRVELWKGLNF